MAIEPPRITSQNSFIEEVARPVKTMSSFSFR
jgi:hypothetical protein